MANTNTINGGSGDVLRDSVANAVGSVVSAMEPQLNQMASKVATQAIDKAGDLANTSYRAIQRQPWYLVGAAAFLLVGAALIIGFGTRELVEDADRAEV